jgi:hypothetical protein
VNSFLCIPSMSRSILFLVVTICSPLLSSCESPGRPSSSKLSARETHAWGTREEVETWERDRTNYFVTPQAR